MLSWFRAAPRYGGRALGTLIGALAGGPPGALIGLAAGWWRDDRRYFHPLRPARWRDWAEDPAERLFLAALFGWAGYLAKLDGRVSRAEIAVVQGMMAELGFDAVTRRVAIRQFSAAKRPGYPWRRYLLCLRWRRPGGPARRWLRLLMQLSLADGPPPHRVERRLRTAAKVLAIDDTEYQRLYGSAQRSAGAVADADGTAWAFELLGVERDAGPADVRLAYRRLVSRHHPDRLAARGVAGAELREAVRRTREAREAYEHIRRLRGW